VTAAEPLLDARALWVVHHDYSGLARAKSVPPNRFEEVMRDGVTFALAAWDYLFTAEPIGDGGFGLESGDFRVIPDPATLVRLPHAEGVAQVVGDLRLGDDPWEGDPRGRLREAGSTLARLGHRPRVALEVEFLVTAEDMTGPVERLPMYGTAALELQWTSWIGPLLSALDDAGIGVHQFAREGSPGQYELSMQPDDPLTACDRYLLARQIIKATVPKPLTATFMPKPFDDLAGNGLHVHLDLEDGDGHSVLPHADDPDALSTVGLTIVAGLLRHAAGQCALGAATPNSYERLVKGSGAPTHATWSFGNRSALVRIPGPGPSRHIEYRAGDAGANVYLHVAGLIASIADALRGPAVETAPMDVDLGTLSDAETAALAAEGLPTELDAALDALEADHVLLEALGSTIGRHYVLFKRFEAANRVAAVADGEALAWDRATYLEAL
jgi:glutamine synthetase